MTIKDIIKNAVKNNIHTIDLNIKSDPRLQLEGLEINIDSYMQFGSVIGLEIIGNDNALIYIENSIEFEIEENPNDATFFNNEELNLSIVLLN